MGGSTTTLQMAEAIALNAKLQRPAVCNAMETLLVDKAVAPRFLPAAAEPLRKAGVILRGCERTRAILTDAEAATEEDWYTEYLAPIVSIRKEDLN